jgi:hypothetical protein
MTHLDLYPVVARDLRTTTHRLLAAFVGLATLVYGGLAVWAAVGTYEEIVTATPDEDTSLYGLGYLFAGFVGVGALLCAVLGLVGWKLARRHPDAGAGVLAAGVALGLVPLAWVVG